MGQLSFPRKTNVVCHMYSLAWQMAQKWRIRFLSCSHFLPTVHVRLKDKNPNILSAKLNFTTGSFKNWTTGQILVQRAPQGLKDTKCVCIICWPSTQVSTCQSKDLLVPILIYVTICYITAGVSQSPCFREAVSLLLLGSQKMCFFCHKLSQNLTICGH